MRGTGSHFAKLDYTSLNAKQKEVHNFHHIAAVLAKHGYASYPIRADWNGGDMIARHMTDTGREMLTIQIKGRLTFDRKYQGKKLWIRFPSQSKDISVDGSVYIFPHSRFDIPREHPLACANLFRCCLTPNCCAQVRRRYIWPHQMPRHVLRSSKWIILVSDSAKRIGASFCGLMRKIFADTCAIFPDTVEKAR